MNKNYYIQKNGIQAVNIWDEYTIYVKETNGLNLIPDSKSIFSRDWPDQQGLDYYLPTTTFFKEKTVQITFMILRSETSSIKSTMSTFLSYLISAGEINYFDTYKIEGFRGYYDKSKIGTERYRDEGNYIEFDLEFTVPNGICFGFDNSGNKSIFVSINSGYADLYYSDGSSSLNVSTTDYKVIQDGFLIICPSILGGVTISGLTNKLLLTSSGKLLLTSSDKLLTA